MSKYVLDCRIILCDAANPEGVAELDELGELNPKVP